MKTDLISRQAAIDALGKEPKFKIKRRYGKMAETDLISRQAAIDALGKEPKFKIKMIKTYAEGRSDQWFKDVATIASLPSAQPERKRGKWIDEAYEPFIISGRCSVCGWEAHLYEDDIVGMNYCPNCGAKMKGEGNADNSQI